jgi:hypothetical protein
VILDVLHHRLYAEQATFCERVRAALRGGVLLLRVGDEAPSRASATPFSSTGW